MSGGIISRGNDCINISVITEYMQLIIKKIPSLEDVDTTLKVYERPAKNNTLAN